MADPNSATATQFRPNIEVATGATPNADALDRDRLGNLARDAVRDTALAMPPAPAPYSDRDREALTRLVAESARTTLLPDEAKALRKAELAAAKACKNPNVNKRPDFCDMGP